MIDSAEVCKYWETHRDDFNGKYRLNEWLVFYKEWVDACNKIKRMAKKQKGKRS